MHVSLTLGKQARLQSLQDQPTWEKPFPVNGQGTFVFNKDINSPFSISVEDKRGHYCLVLEIMSDSVTFIKYEGKQKAKLSHLNKKGSGLEKGKIAYWYSYDRDNLVLKYGKGYRMEETTILVHDFLANAGSDDDKKQIRKDLYPFFNAEEKKFIRKYDYITVLNKGNQKLKCNED